MMIRRGLLIAAAVALVSVASRPASAAQPDAWITTKAKLALLTTEGVSATEVNVDTVGGQVTLHGKVASAAEKDKAEAAVKGIDGVQGVHDLLQVVPPDAKKVVQVTDDQIKDHVEKALKADKALTDSSISVQSVNNGVVLLAGKAASLTAHLDAVMVAGSVAGVRRVSSEIQSPDTLGDSEIRRNRASAKAGGGVTGAARDMWTTSDVKMRLLADSKTPALDINVDTTAGVVTLFGIVPTAAAKAAAAADARKVSGVKAVRNELQVVPKAVQKAVKARDADVQNELKANLERHDGLKGVKVSVKNGVAQLSGSVPSNIDRLQAAVVARSTSGVRSVNDHLQVAD